MNLKEISKRLTFKNYKLEIDEQFGNNVYYKYNLKIGDVLKLKDERVLLVGHINTCLGEGESLGSFRLQDIKMIANISEIFNDCKD